ncbi:hypothetical protein QQL36_29080 [Chitinophaga sp. LS1]|nr:hypothetical protein [Chitinophaga sp. LS1]WPV65859.1 hypothetical protein QQL36_29080 [Chitinophaga sp. LS1]
MCRISSLGISQYITIYICACYLAGQRYILIRFLCECASYRGIIY